MPDNANWEEMLEEFMEDFNPDMVTISDPHKLQTLEEDIKMSDNYTIIDMWKKDLREREIDSKGERIGFIFNEEHALIILVNLKGYIDKSDEYVWEVVLVKNEISLNVCEYYTGRKFISIHDRNQIRADIIDIMTSLIYGMRETLNTLKLLFPDKVPPLERIINKNEQVEIEL